MTTSVDGIYRDGKIELAEAPLDMEEGTPVVITFLTTGPVDLQARGIDPAQAAEIRARLATFAEDWDSPEMSVYDDAKFSFSSENHDEHN